MSHYLITGGAGFIGTHLVQLLLNEGHEVRVLDDLSTGSISNFTLGNIEFTKGNILDYNVLEKQYRNIDGCLNLAVVSSVHKSINNWHYSHQVNLQELLGYVLYAEIGIDFNSNSHGNWN